MIYYFSGTGNSYAAAKYLAEGLGEDLMDIAVAIKENKYEYTLKKDEKLGFVFPVYAWAPPKAVTEFVKNLELYYSGDPYIFAVCTCGASAGRTMDFFEKALEENGLVLDSGFSVVMPDNCITLFEPDSEEEVAEKLEKADQTLDNILRAVKLSWSDFFRVKRGKFSGVLSGVVSPAFNMGALKTKPFYVTDACIGCGSCAAVCPQNCIMTDSIPYVIEQEHCLHCGNCMTKCSVGAVERR
jgi:ferredoxin